MGFIIRLLGCLSPYLNPSNINDVPSVQPQVSNLSVHLSSFQPSHGPSDLKLMALSRWIIVHQYLDDWFIKAQSQEEAQLNTQIVVDLTQSLDCIINQKKSELIAIQVFSFVGYDSHNRQMPSLLGPKDKVKAWFDCKMFDIPNWVPHLNREDGPRESPSYETLFVATY